MWPPTLPRNAPTFAVALACAAIVAPALIATDTLPGQASIPVDGAHGLFLFSAVADRLRGAADLARLDEIWHPVGRPLLLAAQNVVDAVLAAPLLWVFGPARGLALFTALVLATNALAGAWLGRVVGGSGWAALGGAVALGFCPYAWGEVDFGRTTQAWLAPMAIAVGSAWTATEGWKGRVAAGAALAFAAYHYWFYGLFAAVAVAGAVIGRSGRRGVGTLVAIGAVAVALVAPFVAYVALSWDEVPGTAVTAARFAPGAAYLGGLPWSPGRGDLYVPHALLLLAAAALLGRSRRVAIPLLLAAFALGVFALGSRVEVGDTTVWLPFAWLKRLPGLRRFWWPNRALGAVTVALIPALALTLGALRGRWRLAGGAGLALVVAQCLVAPGPMATWRLPPVGSWHAALRDGAVLVLPMTQAEAGMRALAQQPLHGRPLVNGMSMWERYLWPADWSAWAAGQPLVTALLEAEAGRPASATAAGAATLAAAGVAGIVVARADVDGPQAVLSTALGAPSCVDAWCWWELP